MINYSYLSTLSIIFNYLLSLLFIMYMSIFNKAFEHPFHYCVLDCNHYKKLNWEENYQLINLLRIKK